MAYWPLAVCVGGAHVAVAYAQHVGGDGKRSEATAEVAAHGEEQLGRRATRGDALCKQVGLDVRLGVTSEENAALGNLSHARRSRKTSVRARTAEEP